MACERCASDDPTASGWCAGCERDFDRWSRRHAGDIVWATLAGMVVVLTVAIGIPLLGAPMLVATAGVFAGFGTIYGIARLSKQRRRAQFLRGAAVPRAYLPSKT